MALSEPGAAYYRPVANWIAFEKPATIVVPRRTGASSWRTRRGGLPATSPTRQRSSTCCHTKAIPGTEFAAVSDMTVGWFSTAGVVIATGRVGYAVMADRSTLRRRCPARPSC